MGKKLLAVALSVLLLSLGWLGISGLSLLVALVSLLWISHTSEDSSRGWWSCFGYSALAFLCWNGATVWWIGLALPFGPVGAGVYSTILSMIGFMLYHTISKRAPRALAYTALVSVWIALEYFYTEGEVSWPWLLLGNGFSNDIWAVQWYEYTGLFGGSLWVLLSNILIFEAWRQHSRGVAVGAGVVVIAPILLSLAIYWSFEEPKSTINVAIVQPNFSCYDEEQAGSERDQEAVLLKLANEAVDENVDFVVMPETTIPTYLYEDGIEHDAIIRSLQSILIAKNPEASIITGAQTLRFYSEGEQSETARRNRSGDYYDIYNAALYIPSLGPVPRHHKSKLVIGSEKTPMPWLFDTFSFMLFDLGRTMGQLGVGTVRQTYQAGDVRVGAAICYEALYGAYFGEFVQNGARAMFVISNDGWWGDTLGYRHLFSMSRLRAVEHRRAIARSANTGKSGFISARGDEGESLGWEQRGVIRGELSLSSEMTLYTKYGDYIARIAIYVALLSLLYYVAYRFRKRNNLV